MNLGMIRFAWSNSDGSRRPDAAMHRRLPYLPGVSPDHSGIHL